ncbi:MAG TPA: hypothetical protein VFF06_27625 [Polyangia bacterium]|nr:hypothetical protein [Polyangia bacterium]
MRQALWIAVLTLFGRVAGDARAEPRAVISDAPEIPTLERLATLTLDDDPDKPKILHRLADAYDQRARELARLAADESNESRHIQLERKQQAFERLSMNAWAVLADDPKWSRYARRDEALFRAAELAARAHDDERARRWRRELLAQYPLSRLVPEVLLSSAEDAFERKDWAGAHALYLKVMEHRDAPVFAYARYKAAWSQFNLGNLPQARALFAAAAADASNPQLQKEARKDLAAVEQRLGAPPPPDFAKLEREAAALPDDDLSKPGAYAKLAEQYTIAGRGDDAIRTYRAIADRPEKFAAAPQFDTVLLGLASQLAAARRWGLAARYATRLVQDAPRSRLVPKAAALLEQVAGEFRKLGRLDECRAIAATIKKPLCDDREP